MIMPAVVWKGGSHSAGCKPHDLARDCLHWPWSELQHMAICQSKGSWGRDSRGRNLFGLPYPVVNVYWTWQVLVSKES
jgi:hypothetical protein